MRKDGLDEDWVRAIWEHSILPYLEDLFFDEPDRLREFAYDSLRPSIGAADPDDRSPDDGL
jgi:hypothetical protein